MKQNRISYLSLISVVSALAVVMLHTNACFWEFSTERYWAVANVIESVMYFAVPLFFMVSGVTLIEYRERYSTKEFFQKRIVKTLIPFLVWSAGGVVYKCIMGWYTVEFSFRGITTIILDILNVNVIPIYWFFVPLFGMYLTIPLLAAVEQKYRESVFQYLIVLGLLLNQIIPFVCGELEIGYSNRISLRVVGGYVLFVLIGYMLHKHEFAIKMRLLIYVLGIIGLLVHIVGTYVLSIEAGQIINTYKGYENLPCVLYSIAIFVFLQQLGKRMKSQKVIDVIEFLSKYTFAVYLLHWFVMTGLVRILHINTHSIFYRVGAPFVIFAICIGLTWCIRKIPILRKIVP